MAEGFAVAANRAGLQFLHYVPKPVPFVGGQVFHAIRNQPRKARLDQYPQSKPISYTAISNIITAYVIGAEREDTTAFLRPTPVPGPSAWVLPLRRIKRATNRSNSGTQ